MTKRELRMLYKRETGLPAIMGDTRRMMSVTDEYRIFIDYFNWLEDELIRMKELRKKLIPWEK